MPIQTTYYCIKSATGIARLAIEYQKLQELEILNSELERQRYISNSILSFSHLIRDDIQSLMHTYFKSALAHLNYALNASGNNQDEYLRQAKSKFIDATTVEQNENLILSYMGLAFCQAMTNDKINCIETLKKIPLVSCCLPDDYEILCSMDRYNGKWRSFLFHCLMEKVRSDFSDRTLNINALLDKYTDNPEVKKYLERHLKALSMCGGFVMGGEILIDNDKRALKLLLEEEFNSFKSAVISKFNL